jgi:hypothetical protein
MNQYSIEADEATRSCTSASPRKQTSWPTSALPPIPTELVLRNERSRCAISDLTRRSKKAPLFGHLVGIRGTGITEYLAADYSGLMLASRITLPHFSV